MIDEKIRIAVAVQVDPLHPRVREVDARQSPEAAEPFPSPLVTVPLEVSGFASLEAHEVQVAVAVEVLKLEGDRDEGGDFVDDLHRAESAVAEIRLVEPAALTRVQDAREALVPEVDPLVGDAIESARDVVRGFCRLERGGRIPAAVGQH